jgi:hypothetical protein
MEGNAKIVSNDKRLDDALEEVRTNREEADKFAADPQGYLTSKGVDTKGLHFGGPELTEEDLEHVAGGVARQICGSVGCVACVSVG